MFFIKRFVKVKLLQIINFEGSHGIEPTLSNLICDLIQRQFYSYYNLQCIKIDKERKNVRKKKSFMQKHLTQFFKMGSIDLVLSSIPRLPILRYNIYLPIQLSINILITYLHTYLSTYLSIYPLFYLNI